MPLIQEPQPSLAKILNKTVVKLLELLVLVDEPKFFGLSETAELLEVSESSVSRAVQKLYDEGLLIVEDIRTSPTGRPSKTIHLNYDSPTVRKLVVFIEAYHGILHKTQETPKP